MDTKTIKLYKRMMIQHEIQLILDTIHGIERVKVKELVVNDSKGFVNTFDLTKEPFNKNRGGDVKLCMQYMYKKFTDKTLTYTDVCFSLNYMDLSQNENIGLYTEEFWDRMDKAGYGHLRKQNWLLDILTKKTSIIERKNKTLLQGISTLRGTAIYENKYPLNHRNNIDNYISKLIDETEQNLKILATPWNPSKKNKKLFFKYYERVICNPTLFNLTKEEKEIYNEIFNVNYPKSWLKFYDFKSIP